MAIGGGYLTYFWFLIPLAALLALMMWSILTYNHFARLRNLTEESWSDVDVALKRRHDLVPNLVEAVRGYAAHERDLLDRVLAARNAIVGQSDVQSLGIGESKLSGVIATLLARAEAYPDLKASEQFLELQEELANTEDRIAAARRLYNGNVRDYRIVLESFPSSLLAGKSIRPSYFEMDHADRLTRVVSTPSR
ncbi:MAG: LemA family protein [Fimbriimonadales bacterium]